MRVESQDPKSWCLIDEQIYMNTARATTMRYVSIFLSINDSNVVVREGRGQGGGGSFVSRKRKRLAGMIVHTIA